MILSMTWNILFFGSSLEYFYSNLKGTVASAVPAG